MCDTSVDFFGGYFDSSLTQEDHAAGIEKSLVAPEVGGDPGIAPIGGSQFEPLLTRVGEAFTFGQIDAAEAAQQMVDELGAAIG